MHHNLQVIENWMAEELRRSNALVFMSLKELGRDCNREEHKAQETLPRE